MKIYVKWNVPVHDEFLRLAYLNDSEKQVLDSWVNGDSVISQSFKFSMSESAVKNTRKNILKKYKEVMPYSSTLQSAWSK